MKKIKSGLCVGLLTLFISLSSCGGESLQEITKPYLGAYECESAKLGEKEYIDDFSFIRLELRPDGTFSLYYRPKNGDKREETGAYVYDEKEETLQLTLGGNGEFKRKFPLKEGRMEVTVQIGTQTLFMRFTQK